MNIDPAGSRAVKFAEINPLPGSKHKRAVFQRYDFRRAEKAHLEMGGGISFHMFVMIIPGDHLVDGVEHIRRNRRIGIFIDGNGGRGMHGKNMDQAVNDPGFPDCRLNL